MTRRINISGIIFNVEPVGYQILRAYLDAWSQMNHQAKVQWEEMAAEYLLQQLNGNSMVTTTDQVEKMQQALPDIPFPTTGILANGLTVRKYFNMIAFGLW